MANYVLVRHKVRDYSAWKPGYDSHLPVREAAGLTEKKLLHEADDPNNLFILFKAEDLAKAKAFTESADLKQKMEEVGVVDRPDMWLLTD